MENQCHQIAEHLRRIGRMHHRIIENRIRGLGIHPSQHILLMVLTKLGPMASQAKIAGILDVSPASVARTLKNLDQGGYIQRADASEDCRRNEISITEKGSAIVKESRRLFEAANQTTFADFTPEELDQLASLLQKMQKNLCEMEKTENIVSEGDELV